MSFLPHRPFLQIRSFYCIVAPIHCCSVCQSFFDNVFKPHGLSKSIVSDQDVTFTSSFWTQLFRLSCTCLCLTSAYHPQSDDLSEAVNRIIEMYLCCSSGDFSNKRLQWLSWTEFCYNTGFQLSLRATPFEVVYGRPPPQLLSYCVVIQKYTSSTKHYYHVQVLLEL